MLKLFSPFQQHDMQSQQKPNSSLSTVQRITNPHMAERRCTLYKLLRIHLPASLEGESYQRHTAERMELTSRFIRSGQRSHAQRWRPVM
jgi:hypothetical protein